MTPKEKADIALTNFNYKETAIEACDWILDEIELIHYEVTQGNEIGDILSDRYKYWIDTRKETEKL